MRSIEFSPGISVKYGAARVYSSRSSKILQLENEHGETMRIQKMQRMQHAAQNIPHEADKISPYLWNVPLTYCSACVLFSILDDF